MARVNVYLPDELAQRARVAGLNVSSVAQDALRDALARDDTDRWLDELATLPSVEVSHQSVLEALDRARDEFGG
ncbi:MAG: type II toxin-antitoxin system CcdA family antitoxin [Solirubrobacteraceae bacterium]